MFKNIKFFIQFESELLKEGSGFRYQVTLENESSAPILLEPIQLKYFYLKELSTQNILVPTLPNLFFVPVPKTLQPRSFFQFEGDLLAHFSLQVRQSYHFQIQIQYRELKKQIPLKKNKTQSLSTEAIEFKVNPLPKDWHLQIEREVLLAIGEKSGYFLKEILVLPLDRYSAYTFNIVPLILPEEKLLILRHEEDPWKDQVLLTWLEEFYPYQEWFKSVQFLNLPKNLLYRLIFSVYAAHEISPTKDEDTFYLPEDW